ncbi:MAG: ABC-type antimicrobial peptide transport system, ATPase component [Firmicutes bacterium]|nr:ABC-type antimicrobial peptide transport system, ATPase component [Bacillota bacterium]
MALIEIENLCKSYVMGEIELEVLKHINLNIEANEFVSIVGPSGSGKSTLMNILGCLDTPTQGKYRLDGIDVGSMHGRKLAELRNRKIGFVFQSFNLLPRLTALENVELPMVYRGAQSREQREKAVSALEMVGLGDRLHHRPAELSGGQQQRVAIARAIVGEPAIILADEPTGNLDSASGKEVMELLQRLNRDGATLIVITHDLEIAQKAERQIFIRDGVMTEARKEMTT